VSYISVVRALEVRFLVAENAGNPNVVWLIVFCVGIAKPVVQGAAWAVWEVECSCFQAPCYDNQANEPMGEERIERGPICGMGCSPGRAIILDAVGPG